MLGAPIDFDENTAAALSGAADVDYPGVQALKMAALESAFAGFRDLSRRQPDAAPAASFARFVDEGGAALARFCVFEAISEVRNGQSWRMWPQDLRDARPAALSTFAREHARRVQFHQFVQWLANAQFAHAAQDACAAGLSLGFCRDLAIGAAPDGAESWSRAEVSSRAFRSARRPTPSVARARSGACRRQIQSKWKQSGGADFAELLRANMRHAGALRIDHVMGLARLFVDSRRRDKPTAGAYVSYPLEILLGAARAGKPPRAMRRRRRRARHGALGIPRANRTPRRAQLSGRMVRAFGRRVRVAEHYPNKAMACVATHDLPTLEGFWSGGGHRRKGGARADRRPNRRAGNAQPASMTSRRSCPRCAPPRCLAMRMT